MICAYCGENNEVDAVFCGACGKRLQPVEATEEVQTMAMDVCLSCGQPLEEGALFCGSCGARIADMDDEQDNDDDWSEEKLIRTVLIRKRTGERVVIDKYPFVIGRNQACNYQIMNNLAIGRQHVSIDLFEQSVYITDLGSSNHTFIGGRQIENRTEIHDGMKVRFADEDFDIIIL